MLAINMNDVVNALKLCAPYLIALGVVLVLGIIVMIACGKCAKSKKYLVRTQSAIAMVLGLVLIVNLICFGPMSTLISLATGKGSIADDTIVEAQELCIDVAEEGIVLLDNKGTLPLAGGAKLNVFGWASTNPCYGGVGSGSLSDSYPTVSLLEGLKGAGITTNDDVSKFYTDYRADRPEVGMWEQDWTLPEPPANTYGADLLSGAKSFSDTAMIVITRVGGEGTDIPTNMGSVTYHDNTSEYKDFQPNDHYLQLSKSEEDMVKLVTDNFDNVIVVYNGAAAFELGFTRDYPQIKSVIWCPGTGQNGFTGLGNILTGAVNPSGKTVDTFVYDLTAIPSYNNIGDFTYTGGDELGYTSTDFRTGVTSTMLPHFVKYVEGIYVGYKFYETAASEGLIDYDKTVLYPFGHGLSYTSFQQEMGDITENNGTITFDVTVTNTGAVAGKDVVEVYYNPPYTNGGIEKATANLVAYDKTAILEPGASETLTITFTAEDLASYDMSGKGGYVLEAGDYTISINADSHTVLDSGTYTVASTISYADGRSTDATPANNIFDFAKGEDVEYLSRKDSFANYASATAAPSDYDMPDYAKDGFYNNNNYIPEEHNDPNDVMPLTNAKNGLKLADLRGKDYDDAQWELLLDQLTLSDMNTLISLGGYQTAPAPSVGKVNTIDCDGPASINNNFTGKGSIGFPSAVMIAATWNDDIAQGFGDSIGKMADEMGVSGWYAPAMNIHRSAFSGRNFEYFSEDSLLSGRMAAKAVAGARAHGVYAYMKHFALNDQEINRGDMLCTWSNEQAIREIYVRPFEMAVKEGGCQAVMSAFNYIGNQWAGACSPLLNDLLRSEWGFRGMVLTDFFGGGAYMDAEIAIRNGNDVMLAPFDSGVNNVHDQESATSVQAMRTASKNVLYTVVNSRAYAPENLHEGPQAWQITAMVIDAVVVLALLALEILVIRKGYQKRKADEVVTETTKQ